MECTLTCDHAPFPLHSRRVGRKKKNAWSQVKCTHKWTTSGSLSLLLWRPHAPSKVTLRYLYICSLYDRLFCMLFIDVYLPDWSWAYVQSLTLILRWPVQPIRGHSQTKAELQFKESGSIVHWWWPWTVWPRGDWCEWEWKLLLLPSLPRHLLWHHQWHGCISGKMRSGWTTICLKNTLLFPPLSNVMFSMNNFVNYYQSFFFSEKSVRPSCSSRQQEINIWPHKEMCWYSCATRTGKNLL